MHHEYKRTGFSPVKQPQRNRHQICKIKNYGSLLVFEDDQTSHFKRYETMTPSGMLIFTDNTYVSFFHPDNFFFFTRAFES